MPHAKKMRNFCGKNENPEWKWMGHPWTPALNNREMTMIVDDDAMEMDPQVLPGHLTTDPP